MYLPYIDPVAIAIGPVAIRWYALTWVLGAVLALVVAMGGFRARWGWETSQGIDCVSYCLLGALLGGRLGYVLFYGLEQLSQDWTWGLRVWEGGMSFHGGAIGVVVSLVLFARRMRVPMLELADEVCRAGPLALGLVRVGNFINGELWGRVSDMPWAVVFYGDPLRLPRHPSQLYEAVLEGPILFLLLHLVYMRRRYMPGTITFLFFMGYGVMRIAVELFREPDAHIGFDFLGVVTRGQWLSLLMMMVVGIVWVFMVRRARQSLVT